ncbi:hypothetical protein DDT48_20750 [Mycobacteroides abscessus]|uniref:hypothetical protein n=1 Tax=Mycobacteroides abscessus TaxID=36809 RepID=UPI0008A83AE3|nr:hypothetical protein [Mycobacteroides abscessus]AWG51581.1 hypothetical protein DDT48_20750 [Mycobacteroides abscessus]OHU67395.1 hypothetical protein BKG87_22130 [Mycobacteroides chelonae]
MAAKDATPYIHTEIVDGVENKYTFKSFSLAPRGFVRKYRKEPIEGSWQLLEWALSEEDLAKFDSGPIVDTEAIIEAWQAASEVTAGE